MAHSPMEPCEACRKARSAIPGASICRLNIMGGVLMSFDPPTRETQLTLEEAETRQNLASFADLEELYEDLGLEAAHLLRSPTNAERLLTALARAQAGLTELQSLISCAARWVLKATPDPTDARVAGRREIGQRICRIDRINRAGFGKSSRFAVISHRRMAAPMSAFIAGDLNCLNPMPTTCSPNSSPM
jgi:hypothetical protein